MKILLFVLAITLCSGTAFAEGPQLFKDFSFGQPRADLLQKAGMVPCDEVEKEALCREGQKFAGFSDWEQLFLFRGGKLSLVALTGPTDDDRYVKTIGTITNNGFIPAVLQSGDKYFDFIKEVKEKGKAAAADLATFEAAALNGASGLTFTFIEKADAKGAAKTGSFISFIGAAPQTLRAVEVEIAGDDMYVRFLAPKAALADQKKQIEEQKESF